MIESKIPLTNLLSFSLEDGPIEIERDGKRYIIQKSAFGGAEIYEKGGKLGPIQYLSLKRLADNEIYGECYYIHKHYE